MPLRASLQDSKTPKEDKIANLTLLKIKISKLLKSLILLAHVQRMFLML
jgi:hypothetical protein